MSFAETLESVLGDESIRRREFPVVSDTVYLAHAAVCPLPACVVSAQLRYLERAGRGGQFEHLHAAAETEARSLAAAMIGASAEEIAFVPSTSAGLSLVAAGLPWRAGDSVVFAEGDFPSNVYPWLRLEKLGVELRMIPARGDGVVTLEDVVTRVDASTRLVALSSVHYATGARTDIDAIGRYLQTRDVLFCVDAIQSLGAVPLSARYVDFMVADAHKWLMGPQGIGLFFVRRSRFDSLEPVLLGWKSVNAQRDFVSQKLELADTARRYEPGSLNALGIVGLHAALAMLQQLGVDAIAKRLSELRAHLVPALLSKGYEVLAQPANDAAPSGIVSFRRDGADMPTLGRALDANRIVVSLRPDPRGRACLRIAPHFYNTTLELDRLLAQL
jgi:cysteine desulfurase/selenocysteine lyase